MDDNLRRLENQSVFIMREVYRRFKKPAILASFGKDSTVMLHLARKSFFGKIPFPVVHLDTNFKFDQMYAFRDKLAKDWGFELIIAQNKNTVAGPRDKLNCCTERKTEALKKIIKEKGYDAILVGIRRDEHGVRSKERVFSPRDKDFKWQVSKIKDNPTGDSPYESLQDTEFEGWGIFATEFKDANHVRVHPVIHWTETEIWEYIKEENLPVVNMYFSQDGKRRYRSLGCIPCTEPVESSAKNVDEVIEELKTTKVAERSGRAQDKETSNSMEALRSLGYL